MLDRALQILIVLLFDPIIKKRSDLYSYGARKFQNPHDALSRLLYILNKPNLSSWILDVDILKYLDNISHKFIENEIETILCEVGKNFIKKWLKVVKVGIVDKGVIVTPLLSNMTLNGIDEIVRPNMPRIGTVDYKK